MITLNVLKLLEDEGFGSIWDELANPTGNLFWEEVPLDGNGRPKNGLWIVPRASSVTSRNVRVQQFDIYSRYTNKLTGSKKLEAILEYFEHNSDKPCELPLVEPYTETQYTNIRIIPLGSIENVGLDENGKVVRVISAEVRYNKLKEN